VLVMCGHLGLAFIPGLAGVTTGLILIALGSGGVKATATAIVGTLYADDDPRRDAGFSLFYLGINLGALLGPLLTGLLQKDLGFHIGFAAAAAGMAVGLIQYAMSRRSLPDRAREIANPLPRHRFPLVATIAAAAIILIVVLAVAGLLPAAHLSTIVVVLSVLVAVAYFTVILTSHRITTIERRRVLAFIPLFIASAAFWSLYQQQFTVVTIYSDQRLDRTILGWTMPVSWVQSINPVMIILLSGVFAALWLRLGDRQPSTPVKFALGTATMGAAFLLFLPFAGTGPNGVPLLGLAGIILLFTIAELLLSPVGLSLATKLAPEAFHTQMVALFFLSVALGSVLSGTLAEFYSVDNQVAYVGILGAIAIVIGIILAVMTPWLKRLMSGVR
jgi:POT family proton-dependent oligopeptide transporter